jgi:SAM-dependent methyltransferase
VSDADRLRLRATFEEVAEAYDRARPCYPEPVFDDLMALAGLRRGDRVLEIGPGTGQATGALAARGLRLTAVELGPELAAVARRRLARFPQVEVVQADVESWDGAGGFDAVVAFTAFHWLHPDGRFATAAARLRDGGALAVVETTHVLEPGGDPFFVEVQADYDAVDPRPDNRPPGPAESVPDLTAAVESSGLFVPVGVRRHVWDVTYSADGYVALLDTYSGHRSLPQARREELYRRIRRRIAARPGGRVRKTYLATLTVARRR